MTICLCLFKTINSIDNTIINAEVLATTSKRFKKKECFSLVFYW